VNNSLLRSSFDIQGANLLKESTDLPENSKLQTHNPTRLKTVQHPLEAKEMEGYASNRQNILKTEPTNNSILQLPHWKKPKYKVQNESLDMDFSTKDITGSQLNNNQPKESTFNDSKVHQVSNV